MLNYNLNVFEKLINFPEFFVTILSYFFDYLKNFQIGSLCQVLFNVNWINNILKNVNILNLNQNDEIICFFQRFFKFSQLEITQQSISNYSKSQTFFSFQYFEKILWFCILPCFKQSIKFLNYLII